MARIIQIEVGLSYHEFKKKYGKYFLISNVEKKEEAMKADFKRLTEENKAKEPQPAPQAKPGRKKKFNIPNDSESETDSETV